MIVRNGLSKSKDASGHLGIKGCLLGEGHSRWKQSLSTIAKCGIIYQLPPTTAVAFHCLFHRFGLVLPAIVNLWRQHHLIPEFNDPLTSLNLPPGHAQLTTTTWRRQHRSRILQTRPSTSIPL